MDISAYDLIVIGAGHAGCEAALAAARMGCRTLLTTVNLDNLAMMPCNPAVGGPAKGHLVREIDALGGEMGKNTDRTSIQFRMLNTSKGPAVHSLRAQADKRHYQQAMRETVENTPGLQLRQLMIDRVSVQNKQVTGVVTETGEIIACQAVVLATGTYLQSKIVLGEAAFSGGPNGQRPATALSAALEDIGVRLMRFKTGTPARIDSRSVDFTKMAIQPGDPHPSYFSFMHTTPYREQLPCWLTYTNARTHEIIKNNLYRAPLYSGLIKGTGPRYCPSIEVKIVNFPDKEKHQVFVEPEGIGTNEMYVQGMSTSLPPDVQVEMLRTISGLENAVIMRYGYAIEYDCVEPTQLDHSLALKHLTGLYSAGQANGSSGYEEAAAQGLIAGINAALFVLGKKPFILSRDEAYIGVLIDDLVTKGTDEPYRIMTSRAEYRLLLRHDNADIRLTERGYEIGLATQDRVDKVREKMALTKQSIELLKNNTVAPGIDVSNSLEAIGTSDIRTGTVLFDLLRRPGITYHQLEQYFNAPSLAEDVLVQVEIAAKYEGYIRKQLEQVARTVKMEEKELPPDIDYLSLSGLSRESRQKLDQVKPVSLGQASRISGVSPADISVLLIYLEKKRRLANGT
jgi:tRNA uridine 5-carboxymethylaminomethyl modification enzyme